MMLTLEMWNKYYLDDTFFPFWNSCSIKCMSDLNPLIHFDTMTFYYSKNHFLICSISTFLFHMPKECKGYDKFKILISAFLKFSMSWIKKYCHRAFRVTEFLPLNIHFQWVDTKVEYVQFVWLRYREYWLLIKNEREDFLSCVFPKTTIVLEIGDKQGSLWHSYKRSLSTSETSSFFDNFAIGNFTFTCSSFCGQIFEWAANLWAYGTGQSRKPRSNEPSSPAIVSSIFFSPAFSVIWWSNTKRSN